MKKLLLSLLALSTITFATSVEAGCCNSGSGSYRLPSFSSSKNYKTHFVRVRNKTKYSIYVKSTYGEVQIKPGKYRSVLVDATNSGEIKHLSFDSKFYTYNERFITYMPNTSPHQDKEIEFRYKNGELRYYWVTRLGR